MQRDRRILPRPQTCEAKLACVIGERCGNVDSRAPVSTGNGEEHRHNLTEHRPSLTQWEGGFVNEVAKEAVSGLPALHRRTARNGCANGRRAGAEALRVLALFPQA